LLSHNFNLTQAYSTIDLCLADVNVRVQAPDSVLAILDATLLNVPRFASSTMPDLSISVSPRDEIWDIHGADGSHKVLTTQSALPQVGGAIVTSAIGSVASSREYTTMRATVLEKDGRALAMIGDDWESAITLATHLHGRGWSYIGSDNALLDPATREVYCIQKSLYINASSVSQLPLLYRRAVEASPWYVTAQGISFYAVDPSGTRTGRAWTPSAALCGIVVVDGLMTDTPSLESVDSSRLRDERFTRLGLDWAHVSVSELRIGSFVDTCDLVEHWFGSLGF
jgi:hypothetical protein